MKKCSRCKKKYYSNKNGYCAVEHHSSFGVSGELYLLCDECNEKLKKWLENQDEGWHSIRLTIPDVVGEYLVAYKDGKFGVAEWKIIESGIVDDTFKHSEFVIFDEDENADCVVTDDVRFWREIPAFKIG